MDMYGSPMKPAVLYILLALADHESHGYAVMQAVADLSGGRVPLRTGSFYRHLGRLMDDGLVEESPTRKPGDVPRRGAYYRLTPKGRHALASERRRLTELVAAFGASSRRSRS